MAIDFTPDEIAAAGAIYAGPDPGYQWPDNPHTRTALEKWRDHKLGVIIHWGIYSYIGQGGSWSIHRERLGDFTDPPSHWQGSDAEYQTWYYDQARKFTGENFDADHWARVCAQAGMKYLVFTTKHHDGFAMYDTQFSNCKCTAEDAGLGRDIFREVVDAYRKVGLEVGVYFSKADWHHPGYWDRALPITDRFHNYDLEKYSRKWQSFVDFTHNQVSELLTNYGDINVLWLDAGWVREPEEPINIDGLAQMARELQPNILVVDREVHGPEENYRTPEQELPDEYLDYPWESCITMTKSWCSLQEDDYAKPTSEIVANLIKIVARGGNYLLGIGPDATGKLSAHVEQGLLELGSWMQVCGEGIYGTRAFAQSPLLQVKGIEFYPVRSTDNVVYVFGLLNNAVSTELCPAENDSSKASFTITGKCIKAELLTADGYQPLSIKVFEQAGAEATEVVVDAFPTPFAVGVKITF